MENLSIEDLMEALDKAKEKARKYRKKYKRFKNKYVDLRRRVVNNPDTLSRREIIDKIYDIDTDYLDISVERNVKKSRVVIDAVLDIVMSIPPVEISIPKPNQNTGRIEGIENIRKINSNADDMDDAFCTSKWVEDDNKDFWHCNNCGYTIMTEESRSHRFRFCESCGRKMINHTAVHNAYFNSLKEEE